MTDLFDPDLDLDVEPLEPESGHRWPRWLILTLGLIIGLAFVVVNFVVDVLAGYVDPRIRIREEE